MQFIEILIFKQKLLPLQQNTRTPMEKLIIIIKLLLFITLTSCFENETALYQKIADVDTLIRQNQRDSAKAVFGTLDITNAKRNEVAYYIILANRLKIIDKQNIDS